MRLTAEVVNLDGHQTIRLKDQCGFLVGAGYYGDVAELERAGHAADIVEIRRGKGRETLDEVVAVS